MSHSNQSSSSPGRSGKASSSSASPVREQSATAASGSDNSNGPKDLAAAERDKPRLTEQEKKNNHIASEQKRRAAIREGFDRLTEIVPGLEGHGRSEGMVLRKTVDYMQLKQQERRELIAEIERRGGRIDERLRQDSGNI